MAKIKRRTSDEASEGYSPPKKGIKYVIRKLLKIVFMIRPTTRHTDAATAIALEESPKQIADSDSLFKKNSSHCGVKTRTNLGSSFHLYI